MLSLVDRYLIRSILAPALLALAIVVGLVLLLQLLRLGHHVAAALDGRTVGRVLALGLPTLVAFALPLALLAGVLFALGRLGDTSQLVALRALGCSPLRLALPAALLGLLFAAAAFGAATLEPAALRQLHALLLDRAAQALLGAVQPGTFSDLGADATLLVRGRRPAAADDEARFSGLFLARGGAREILVAREATLRFGDGARVALELRDAELQQRNRRGGLRRVRMQRYTEELDLGPAIRPHFAFLLRRAAAGRAHLAAPCACFALSLLGAALGLRVSDRLGAAALGALAAAGVLGLGGALVQLGAGPWGQVGLAAIVGLVVVGWLARR